MNWWSFRFSSTWPRSQDILTTIPASSHASRRAASSTVSSSSSQPPLGRTQDLRLVDEMRRTCRLSAVSGTRPATKRSPLSPYPIQRQMPLGLNHMLLHCERPCVPKVVGPSRNIRWFSLPMRASIAREVAISPDSITQAKSGKNACP